MTSLLALSSGVSLLSSRSIPFGLLVAARFDYTAESERLRSATRNFIFQ
jgi:hypothetical protein